MNHLPAFKLWLQNKHYSDATIRNYLVDLGKYLNYVNRLPQTVSLDPSSRTDIHIISPDIVSLYVSYLTDKNNSARYLASLNQFCQYAIDQGFISQNPLQQALRAVRANPSGCPSPTLTSLISLYQQHLTKHKNSPTTIKNYINDLNQYINWLDTLPRDPQ